MNDMRARYDDHATSHEGAAKVAGRAPIQKDRLLASYYVADSYGRTDEEAARDAELLTSCYWKRCGELRDDGLIAMSGETREGTAGIRRQVSVITDAGRARIRGGSDDGG